MYLLVLKFADGRFADQWASDDVSMTLRSVLNQATSWIYARWHQDIIVTSLIRTPDEDKALYHDPEHEPGVHCYGRGVDVSTRFMSSAEVKGVCNYINERWTYDPARPLMRVAIYETGENPGSSGSHIHFQVHPDTFVVTQADPTSPSTQA